MKLPGRVLFVFVLFTLVSIFGILQVAGQGAEPVKSPRSEPATQTVTAEQKDAIEKIVREYLLKNPNVIRDAMQALQAQEEKEKRELTAKNLKDRIKEIYADVDSPVIGNPKGDVTIVVFFDYNCGYCRKSLPELRTLIAKDPSLRIIYKEFPILGPQSLVAATAALAAGRQGQYEAFSRALFEVNGAGDVEIRRVSDGLKLNYTKLQKDMGDPKFADEIERNVKLATALDINGTPAYIVGDQIIPGAIDMDSLAKLINAERTRNAATKTTPNGPETRK
jgi:protein-disulfide isomerase